MVSSFFPNWLSANSLWWGSYEDLPLAVTSLLLTHARNRMGVSLPSDRVNPLHALAAQLQRLYCCLFTVVMLLQLYSSSSSFYSCIWCYCSDHLRCSQMATLVTWHSSCWTLDSVCTPLLAAVCVHWVTSHIGNQTGQAEKRLWSSLSFLSLFSNISDVRLSPELSCIANEQWQPTRD